MTKKPSFLLSAAVFTAVLFLAFSLSATAQPAGRTLLNDGWTFTKDGQSRVLDLPHDWGVEGDFRQEYPGESGKLAWWGQAVYTKKVNIGLEELLTKDIDLEIDGAMSHATVSVNGIDLATTVRPAVPRFSATRSATVSSTRARRAD